MTTITRRRFIEFGVVSVAGLVSAACAPAATPVGQSSSGTEAPASPSPSAWEETWQQLITEAKKEGVLSVATLPGLGKTKSLDAFQEAFGIQVERQAFSSASLFAPKVTQEHQAGIYTWDIAFLQTPTGLTVLKPAGVWAPLKPLLFRPDVVEDGHWRDGFAAGWLDNDQELTYSFGNNTSGQFTINTDMVKEGEITTVLDLLQPKWTGKLLLDDVRSGGAYGPMTGVRRKYGDDVVKRLYMDQQPTFSRDTRQVGEMMAKGAFPISNGLRRDVLQNLLDGGVGKNLKYLDLPYCTYLLSNNMFVLKNAPHPKAAQLFANWLHAREGQNAFYNNTQEGNSRRIDMPFADPEFAPKPGREYEDITKESVLGDAINTRDWLVKTVTQS